MNQLDGRILRSQKSQNLILDAIIKLINNGNLYPTAQEVAKESGIAIRTVFRQFADMESLLMKVDELINEKLLNEESYINMSLSLSERLKKIIDERVYFYNKYENIMIATVTQLPKYKILQKRYPEYQKLLRKRTEEIIPEILSLKSNSQELLDATLSFAFFERLKFQGMNKINIAKSLNNQCKKILSRKNGIQGLKMLNATYIKSKQTTDVSFIEYAIIIHFKCILFDYILVFIFINHHRISMIES